MTRYSNLWTNGKEVVKSETIPSEDHYAVYAASRVRGEGFVPYEAKDGSASWVRSANRQMENRARNAFQNR